MEMIEKRGGSGAGTRVWIGTGLLLIVVSATLFLTKGAALSEATVLAAAAIGAAGVLGIAALLAPLTAFPRWAHWTSAGMIAAWILAGPALAGSPEAWSEDFRQSIWMMPWFVLTTGGLTQPKSGRCATTGTRGGWFLVGATVLFTTILTFAERIGRAA